MFNVSGHHKYIIRIGQVFSYIIVGHILIVVYNLGTYTINPGTHTLVENQQKSPIGLKYFSLRLPACLPARRACSGNTGFLVYDGL
jgi:hypothetical protein